MKDQLIHLMESESMSPAKLADEIGVQRSSISHILSDRNKPSYDFILKILSRFPGIDVEWLLTGKGSMIKSAQTNLKKTIQATLFDQKSESDKEKPERIISNKEANNQIPFTKEISSPLINDIIESNKFSAISNAVTNVNNINYVIIFYNDGTFEKFISK